MNVRRLALVVLTLLASLVTARRASAVDGPAEHFGHAGHLVLSSDANLSLIHTSVSGGGDATVLSLRPAADYFVIPRLSIGGFVPFQYATSGNYSSTSIGIGARVGFDAAIASYFSIWPQLGLSFNSSTVHVSGTGPATGGVYAFNPGSNNALTFSAYLPFLIHPADHFFVGLGPRLDADITGDYKTILWGLTFVIGGYFLGD
jgi:hypothetical protein